MTKQNQLKNAQERLYHLEGNLEMMTTANINGFGLHNEKVQVWIYPETNHDVNPLLSAILKIMNDEIAYTAQLIATLEVEAAIELEEQQALAEQKTIQEQAQREADEARRKQEVFDLMVLQEKAKLIAQQQLNAQ